MSARLPSTDRLLLNSQEFRKTLLGLYSGSLPGLQQGMPKSNVLGDRLLFTHLYTLNEFVYVSNTFNVYENVGALKDTRFAE